MIPKVLHFIWVGDEKKRPDNCIQTWADLNPGYEIRIWGNASLTEIKWFNAHHIVAMLGKELCGVADMMRWEILYNEGGILIDADSICVRALDDYLLDCEAFACWENEIARPGLIASGYFGCQAGNGFLRKIIEDISNEVSVINDMAWKTVGPLRLTQSFQKYQYWPLRIYPSYYFIPKHFSGIEYKGLGPIYAEQFWGSTTRSYDELYLKSFT
jgi:mannosyltransferase OCH1-like enzyme